jgi:hypothetical protein
MQHAVNLIHIKGHLYNTTIAILVQCAMLSSIRKGANLKFNLNLHQLKFRTNSTLNLQI